LRYLLTEKGAADPDGVRELIGMLSPGNAARFGLALTMKTGDAGLDSSRDAMLAGVQKAVNGGPMTPAAQQFIYWINLGLQAPKGGQPT
jgi:hypothetical protein